MADPLQLSDLAPHVGSAFQLAAEGGPVELVLVEAEALPGTGGGGRETPFSALFRGPADLGFAQQIVRLEHAQLGALELFVVPLQPDGDGSYFEAVFT